jgi:drug/metabolite transporter (DMT)-like permease
MIAKVRRFSTSARRSMTVRRSTALGTTAAVLALAAAALFWGMNAIASKLLYRDAGFDAFGLLAARGVWTLPLFALMAWIARPAQPPSRREWRRLAVLGFFYGPMACAGLAFGAQWTSGAHVSVLISLAPPLTAVIGGWLLAERVDSLRIAALATGLGGALLLALTRSASGSGIAGDAVMLVQVSGLAMIFVLTRRLGGRFTPTFLTGVYGAFGMAGIAAIGLAAGAAPALARTTASPSTALWFFGEIVLGLSLFGQWAQSYALRTLGAGTVALISSYGSLIVGVAGAVVFLGERIAPSGILATVLMAAALALALLPGGRARYRRSSSTEPVRTTSVSPPPTR